MSEKYSKTRYSRFVTLPIIGTKGMDKIRKSIITIIGGGGLGAVTATQLVAMGIKRLRLIDNDIVEVTNLQRQIMYRQEDVGKPKALIAQKFLQNLNPDVEIEVFQEAITQDNVSLVSKSTDIVIDAVDRFKPRLIINAECLKKNIPFLFGAVSGLSGNTMTIVRNSVWLECLFGHVDDSKLPNSSETGIHPAIINIIGSLQVAEATRIMLNEEPILINKLLFADIGTMEFETLSLKPRDNCRCRLF
ncbi:MAG: HesA/MoeB/ThiF family protein [Asgard group archaeon]|nr:HesA/MoeB/ThiF family protein [Asgard group archaeon]